MKTRWRRNDLKRLLANFTKYRHLLYELVKKDIKLKYRNSMLGLFWTLLEPLLTMIVLTIVFEGVMGRSNKKYDFSVYVLSGRLLYSFFSNGTRLALKSIRKNSHMIRKLYVPKYIYPVSASVSSYVTFVISLVVLVAVAAVKKVRPTVYLMQSVFPLVTILIMVVGIGLILATLDVFFRDMEYIWNIIIMLIMYLSAIFYDAESLITGRYGFLIKYNPLYAIINNFRNSVFGYPMEMKYLLYSTAFSVVMLVAGVVMFYRQQDKFVLYV